MPTVRLFRNGVFDRTEHVSLCASDLLGIDVVLFREPNPDDPHSLDGIEVAYKREDIYGPVAGGLPTERAFIETKWHRMEQS